jgi:hypothetical protein
MERYITEPPILYMDTMYILSIEQTLASAGAKFLKNKINNNKAGNVYIM